MVVLLKGMDARAGVDTLDATDSDAGDAMHGAISGGFQHVEDVELAVVLSQHNSHIPVHGSCRYLSAARAEETHPRFLDLAEQVAVNEGEIRSKIQEEKAKEAARPGAKRYV